MKKQGFSFCLTVSIICHIILVLFFAFYSSWFFKPKKALLIESSIQVDQVGLPDIEPEVLQPKNPDKEKKSPPVVKKLPKKKPKPQKKTQTKKKIPPVKKEKPKAVEPKKTEASSQTKESTQKEAPKPTQSKPAPPSTTDTNKRKGNQISEGSSDGKLLSDSDKNTLTLYANQIVAQTKAYWNLPSYLMNERRVSQVEIKISSTGQISYTQIVSSSGSDLYDSLVLKAIQQAAPYPKPPKSIQKFIKNGIVLSFPNQ